MSLVDTVNSGQPTKVERSATFVPPMQRGLHDPAVTFEEYLHYAKKTREEEKREIGVPAVGLLQQLTGRKPKPQQVIAEKEHDHTSDSKERERDLDTLKRNSEDDHVAGRRKSSLLSGHATITDDEWRNASRALRSASWGAGFYIITTDILGPYGVGFALGTLGWGPGIALYTVFAFMAGYCGYLLWQSYLGLDSYEYPARNYGDLAYRTMGNWARHGVNVLQSLQLLLVTGQVIIQNGQGISQTSKFRLCYIVCVVVVVVAGFVVGQVRGLQNFGVISMIAVGLNLMVIFISMGVMAHSPPNYGISVLGSAGSAVDASTITPYANGTYPAIIHYAGLPDSKNFVGAINGLMSGVFAYGGANLFVEIMAEMRRPWDFFKAMWSAQAFIWIVYLSYGCYTYYWQGQYSFQISYIGLSVYGFQATCDMLSVISGLIAAALYGNIGIKVMYNQVFMEFFKAPPINTPRGKATFAIIVPIYWSVAFVIAAAIPDYFGFVSVIAAFCIIQFSYSFPPIIHLAYTMQKNSIRPGEGFNEVTGETTASSRGIKRWVRGFMSGGPLAVGLNCWHVIVAGGSLATAGLGAYAAIDGMIAAFADPQVNSFTCASPLNYNAGTQ